MRTTRLIASVLALVLVAVSILPQQVAHAQQPPLGEQESIAVLQSYNIVRGDTSGNLNLDAQLTRAQAATIFVRAMNADELAPLMAEDVPFTDAKGHWAAGEIAIAARLGLMKGDGNGLFRPEAEITYAEIFTVLLRMLKREPTGPWSPELVMLHANQLPIVPPGINGRAVAIRRTIFWALAAAVTSVPVEGHPNLLRKHIDQEPPTLGLDLAAATTADSSFAITGTVVGGTRVLVNGNPASLDLSSGRFTYKAALESGTNTLVVEAFDAAGNKAVKEMTVEKQAVIARLTITGPKTLLANTSTRLTVEAKDSKGNLLSADGVDVEMTGEVATFNRTNWTLVTGSKAGKGTLTLRAGSARATYSFEVVAPSSRANALRILPINGDRPLALQKEETVTVQVVDSAGRVVADDFGRVITLSTTGQVPLTIDPVSPITEKGVALFKVTGVEVGHATLSASTPGLSTVNRPLEVLTARRIMLVPSAKSLMPDGTSSVTIKAILQDENGRNTNNDTGTDIQIHLTATGTDSVLDGSYLTIPKGRADSGSASVKLTAGIAPGITTIRGTTAHPYAIQTLEFPVDTPLPGVRLEVIPTATSVVPGGQTTVKVRVVDGSNRLVTSGSYAFQLAATTSNNDPLHEGLPDGVTISYPNSPYYPVNDGRAVTDPQNDPYSVIGRTERGEATVTLRYNRSGIVQVKPVLLPATTEAYHPNAGMGPASASTGLLPMPADIYFQGAAARLELTVDSAIGTGLKGGALGGAGTVTLKARVVDTFGATVPGFADLITITRLTSSDGVSNFDGVQEKRAVNGVAVFTIQAYDQAGVDLYRVSTGTFTSEPVTVAVRKTTAFQPAIVAIRGVKEGGLSPVTGFVGAEADYMEIQLQSQAVDEKEQQYWVQAKVYRSGESSPFYSQAIDLRNPLPIIRIPRAVLKTGQYRYSVVI
ncbi:MAG: S-layer homology domain-containing protein, partial [Bacillota bacterium]